MLDRRGFLQGCKYGVLDVYTVKLTCFFGFLDCTWSPCLDAVEADQSTVKALKAVDSGSTSQHKSDSSARAWKPPSTNFLPH